MAVQWYCKIGDQELGPITAELLKQLAEQGQLRPDSPIRSGDSGQWLPARRVRGLFPDAGSGSDIRTAPAARAGQAIKRAKPLTSKAHDTQPAHDTLPLENAIAESAAAAAPAPVGRPVTARPAAPSSKPPASRGPKPPPPRISDSAPLPMGVPVGVPVAPPALAPMAGGPVAGGPVAGGPVAGGPVGPALAGGAAAPVVTTAEAGVSALSERSQKLIERRKSSNPLVLVAILGGAVLVIGLVGGVLLWTRGGGDSKLAAAPDNLEAADDSETPVDPERDPESPDPESSDLKNTAAAGSGALDSARLPSGNGASNQAADGNASPGAVRKADAQLLAALKEIRKWADASRVRVRSGQAEVRIDAAWLEDKNGEAADTASASPDSSSSVPEGSRVCVQLSVTNVSNDSVVDYSSWNGTGILRSEAKASLLGSGNRDCPLVPLDQAQREERQTSVAVEPGKTVQDLLVFQAPTGPVDDLRLVLPRSALGSTGHMGFNIPRVMLVSGTRPKRGGQSDEDLATNNPDSNPPATASTKPTGDAQSAKTGPANAGAAEPGAPAPPEASAPPEDRPLTFDDLKRSIEGDPKPKQPEPKQPEPQP